MARRPAADDVPLLWGDEDCDGEDAPEPAGPECDDPWAEWRGMPEFVHEDLQPVQSIRVHFASRADADAFAALIGQVVTERTRALWYPPAEIGHYADRRYVSRES